MQKILVFSYPHTSNYAIIDERKVQQEITNLMSSYGVIKVIDYTSVYTKKSDGNYWYEGDVCYVEGSRFVLWLLNKFWGDVKPEGIFSYEIHDNKIRYKAS